MLDVDGYLLVAPEVSWAEHSVSKAATSRGSQQVDGAPVAHEYLDGLVEASAGVERVRCAYGVAALAGLVVDLESVQEGNGVHRAIYKAAARFVEMSRAGCWDADDAETLTLTTTGLRAAEPRQGEFEEALTSALKRVDGSATPCTVHGGTAASAADVFGATLGETCAATPTTRERRNVDMTWFPKCGITQLLITGTTLDELASKYGNALAEANAGCEVQFLFRTEDTRAQLVYAGHDPISGGVSLSVVTAPVLRSMLGRRMGTG